MQIQSSSIANKLGRNAPESHVKKSWDCRLNNENRFNDMNGGICSLYSWLIIFYITSSVLQPNLPPLTKYARYSVNNIELCQYKEEFMPYVGGTAAEWQKQNGKF